VPIYPAPSIGSFGIVKTNGTANASWGAVNITGDFNAGDMLIWNGTNFDAVEQEGEYATAAQGTLAETALQPEDIGSAAYNATEDFATAAQGALADTALQPNDNISELNNNLAFIDATGVTSANLNLTGSVGTDANQVAAGNHLHTGVYATAAQGALAETAVQNVQGVTGIWRGTQEEYDLLTPDADTLYIIV
jgi:hypothetical protein